MNKLETKQEIIDWLQKEIKIHKEVEAETWNTEQQKLKDFIVGLESVFDYVRETQTTLIDASLLIERIITHIEANKNNDNLEEQIFFAVSAANDIGPRLAEIAGCKWLPKSE